MTIDDKIRDLLKESRVTRDGFFDYEINELVTAIKSALRESLPKEKIYTLDLITGWGSSGDAFCGGFNECRKYIEDLLK
jgi:hypothetical protein